MTQAFLVSAADLRAEMARKWVKLYKMAARVGLNPHRLGQMLNERLAMPPAVAERIAAALESWGCGNA